MRVAVKFAYDGRDGFHGFARQPGLRTIEGELLSGLKRIGLIDNIDVCCFRYASRTDKDVSAMGNVFAFNTDNFNHGLLEEYSNVLDDSIIPYGFQFVEADFNPRYAKYRWYRYYLASKNLDIDKIISASSIFTGEHDFSNFARVENDKNPVRCIDNIVFTENKGFLVIDFFAQSFLWNQIRRIVSALKKVGMYKIDETEIAEALSETSIWVDFGLANPRFLFLMEVFYGFDFKINKCLFDKTSYYVKDFD